MRHNKLNWSNHVFNPDAQTRPAHPAAQATPMTKHYMIAPKNTMTSTDGLPFTISPSTSYLRLNANEAGKSSVEFMAWFQTENRHGTIRFEFIRCISARLLALGGEAGHGIGVVLASKWLAETKQCQVAFFPASSDNLQDVKHYFLRGHDCSVEVLAEGYTWSECGG